MTDTKQAKTADKKIEPYRVTARHNPLRSDHKHRVVDATDKDSAWAAYLKELRELLTEENYPKSPKLLREAREWLKKIKQGPEKDQTVEEFRTVNGIEILPEEYIRRRRDAMRIRGAVKPADVGGFAELASA